MREGVPLQISWHPADNWPAWHDYPDGEAAMARSGEPKREYPIYVVELDRSFLRERKFAEANPGYIEGKPCVYVGMTGRTPELRFAQHRCGNKAARFARIYCIRLKPRQYKCHNPMTRQEAELMEVEKARRLRKRGYGVWQN